MTEQASLKDLYQQKILENSKHPKRYRQVDAYTHSAEGYNRMCGDKVIVQLRINAEGVVEDVGFQGESCAVCKSSSSLLLDQLSGLTISQVMELLEDLKIFADTWQADASKIGDMICFQVLESFPTRKKCLELPWSTLEQALLSAPSKTRR